MHSSPFAFFGDLPDLSEISYLLPAKDLLKRHQRQVITRYFFGRSLQMECEISNLKSQISKNLFTFFLYVRTQYVRSFGFSMMMIHSFRRILLVESVLSTRICTAAAALTRLTGSTLLRPLVSLVRTPLASGGPRRRSAATTSTQQQQQLAAAVPGCSSFFFFGF